MKQSCILILTLVAAMAAYSCTKSGGSPEPTPSEPTSGDWFRREGLLAHYDTTQFEKSSAYLGGAKLVDEAWIRARAGNLRVSDPDEAEIIILGDSQLYAQESVLNEAYFKSKVIIVCNPDLEKIKALERKYGWTFVIPGSAPKGDYALCFCKNHTYVLAAPLHIAASSTAAAAEDHPGVIYINGEEKYENESAFSHGRGLNQFINDVRKTAVTKNSIGASGLDSDANTFVYNIDKSDYWDYTMSCRGGSDRHFRFFSSYRISYSIYPCHAHKDAYGDATDYYTVTAVASNYAPTAYEYDTDSSKPVPDNSTARYWTGKGDKSFWGDCQYMGPFNGQLTFKSHAENSADLAFSTEGTPDPGTAINSQSYSNSQDFSWNVGLSGGKNGENRTRGFNVGIGGKKSNSVSYSVSDIGIVSDADGHNVNYQFNYQNIPTRDDDFDNFRMPDIAHHTGDFEMSWQWTAKKDDGDTSIIPLVTEVGQTIYMWARDKVNGLWKNDLFTFNRSSSNTNTTALEVTREPIGCLRVNNQCSDGSILYDVIVVDGSGQTVYSESQNSIFQGEYIEVLLPQRNQTYGVSLNMGKNSTSKVPYYSTNQAYTLEPMDSPDTKRILNIDENGADFSTDAGVLRVKNQSASNLVMNLTVRTVSDSTAVYTWPNSVGQSDTAEMKLTAGKEYFVTMSYGSASASELYKSAQSFTLPSFHSESDVKILTAADGGGDFVKMQE